MSNRELINLLAELCDRCGVEEEELDTAVENAAWKEQTGNRKVPLHEAPMLERYALQKAEVIFDQGIHSQLGFLLDNGYSRASITQIIGKEGWHPVKRDKVKFEDVVSLTRSCLGDRPISSFPDAQAFGEWLSSTSHADAIKDVDPNNCYPENYRLEALFTYLNGAEAGGTMKLPPSQFG